MTYPNALTLKGRCLILVLALIFLMLAPPISKNLETAEGGTNYWTSHGPPVGIFGLAQDTSNPAIIYAAGETGVFKSIDGGENWSPTALTGYIFDVAVDPQNPTTVYAAARLSGLYKSTDGGANWVLTSLLDPYIYTLLFDPVTPNIVYAGAYEDLYKSTDGCNTWGAHLSSSQ